MTPRSQSSWAQTQPTLFHGMIRPLLLDPSGVYDPLVLELLVHSSVFILPSTHLHFVPTPDVVYLRTSRTPSITNYTLASTHGPSLRIHKRRF